MIDIISKIVSPVIEGWAKRKTITTESKAKLEKAKWELKIAKVNAQIKQESEDSTRDYDYDMQVLRNRNNTIADEAIIILWFVVFILHFIPYTQPLMFEGWAAMGYSTVPWWFEFGMVGILVSTLGLMRVLKLLFMRRADKDSSPKGEAIESKSKDIETK